MCQYDPICTNFISIVNSNNISQMSCDTSEPLLVKTDFSQNNQGNNIYTYRERDKEQKYL